MQAVLISINPKWCEPIASGEKKIEIRKSEPKQLKPPFKAFIYCTQGKGDCLWRWNGVWYDTQDPNHRPNRLDGKVIGEFVCDEITPLFNVATTSWDLLYGNVHEYAKSLVRRACLTEEEMHSYAKGKNCYAWRISDLKIYDKPREISEFSKYGFGHPVPLKRPPQSWMYVEVEG